MTCAHADKCATYKTIRMCDCRKSERDSFVLEGVCKGESYRAIARALKIEPPLVAAAVRRMCKERGVRDRYALLFSLVRENYNNEKRKGERE